MAAPKQIVTAPAVGPAAGGLLQTVRAINETAHNWQSGFSFSPNGCVPATILDPQCGSDDNASIEPSDLPAVVDFIPYLVLVAAHCTSLQGASGADLGARIRAIVELDQGVAVEEELWKGTKATASSWPNFFLAGGSPNFDNLTPGPTDAIPGMYALGALQAALGQCNGGVRGMIHASKQVVTMWQERNLVRREGTAILDLYDNFIIAGAGYDGTGPDDEFDATGNTSWAYATGMVDVRLGGIDTVPTLDRIEQALDRTNDFMWQAQRFAAATWDGCCHIGARVNVCETCCDPDAGGS